MRKVSDIAGTPRGRLVARMKRLDELKAQVLEETGAAVQDFERGDYAGLDEGFVNELYEQLAAIELIAGSRLHDLLDQYAEHVPGSRVTRHAWAHRIGQAPHRGRDRSLSTRVAGGAGEAPGLDLRDLGVDGVPCGREKGAEARPRTPAS